MAALNAQTLSDTGAAPTFGAAALSDTAPVGNGLNTFAVYRNTDSNIKTLTITPPGDTDYGVDLPAKVVSLPATNGEKWIPLRRAYSDDNGRATIVVSGTGGVTGVTVAIVRV